MPPLTFRCPDAPPRTPIELLRLNGGYRPDRHGPRLAAPKSGRPIGDPPDHLAADEAAAWREHVRDAAPGVLTGYDRWALEAVCRLVAKARRDGLTGGELGHLRGFMRELGASPVARGRVRVVGAAEAPAGNPWDVQTPG